MTIGANKNIEEKTYVSTYLCYELTLRRRFLFEIETTITVSEVFIVPI